MVRKNEKNEEEPSKTHYLQGFELQILKALLGPRLLSDPHSQEKVLINEWNKQWPELG